MMTLITILITLILITLVPTTGVLPIALFTGSMFAVAKACAILADMLDNDGE